jgi:signal transduction histidine kinase
MTARWRLSYQVEPSQEANRPRRFLEAFVAILKHSNYGPALDFYSGVTAKCSRCTAACQVYQASGTPETFLADEEIHEANMAASGIHTCLANLVSNAIDACKAANKEKCAVSLRLMEKESVIVFEVEDTGCGMEAEVMEKLFNNFFTTKGLGGTGLGLLVTKKIVREHGARIEVESEPDVGSCFRMEIPRNDPTKAA